MSTAMDAWLRRPRKRGRHRFSADEPPPEAEPPRQAPLVSQGGRSAIPRPGPATMDDLIREGRGRGPLWDRIIE